MARRRSKGIDIFGLAGSFAGLVMMATFFSPQARQAIVGLGIVALGVLGLVIVAFIALAAYRHVTSTEKPPRTGFQPFTISVTASPTTSPRSRSTVATPPLRPCATAAEVLGQKRQPSSSNSRARAPSIG